MKLAAILLASWPLSEEKKNCAETSLISLLKLMITRIVAIVEDGCYLYVNHYTLCLNYTTTASPSPSAETSF